MSDSPQSRRAFGDLSRAAAPALAVIAVFGLALATHGCASSPSDSTEIRTDKEYRTGSNIPVRDRASGDAKSYDPMSVQDAISKSPPPAPRGLKGG